MSEHQVRRIVSLLPSATEILFAIGAGERVVGVTHECDYPPQARTRPALTSSYLPPELQTHTGARGGEPSATLPARIDRHVRASVHAGSSLYALDDTQLATLDPDLIVTQELCAVCAVSYDIVAQAAKRLRGDPRIISLEPSSLDDVYATIGTLGTLTGCGVQAQRAIEGLQARAEHLRTSTRAGEPPRVLLLEWTDPPMSGGHWTPELIELAGGTPLLAHPGADSQTLAWTDIAQADPDVVFVAPCGFDLPRALEAAHALRAQPEWPALRAVREGRAFALDGNAYVNRPGPRLIDTAEIFAACLRGEPVEGAANAS